MLHARKDYNGRIVDLAGKIPADEPVFVIRAQDVTAPAVVRQWAMMALYNGANQDIVTMAGAWADKMEEWQHKHMAWVKIPDLPKEKA